MANITYPSWPDSTEGRVFRAYIEELISDLESQITAGGGSGISNIVEDTTPQLGGNLDTNSFTIDSRTISTDGTKLDTIETSADVTDETNVKAALDGATISTVSVVATDLVLIQDVSNSNNLRVVTAQSIADLAEGSANRAWFGV